MGTLGGLGLAHKEHTVPTVRVEAVDGLCMNAYMGEWRGSCTDAHPRGTSEKECERDNRSVKEITRERKREEERKRERERERERESARARERKSERAARGRSQEHAGVNLPAAV